MLPDGSDLLAEEINDCSLFGIWMGWNSPTRTRATFLIDFIEKEEEENKFLFVNVFDLSNKKQKIEKKLLFCFSSISFAPLSLEISE